MRGAHRIHALAFGAQSVGQQESGERHAVAVVRDGLAGPHSRPGLTVRGGIRQRVQHHQLLSMMQSSGVVMELG